MTDAEPSATSRYFFPLKPIAVSPIGVEPFSSNLLDIASKWDRMLPRNELARSS